MSEPRLALYGYWRSSCSWRVRIALQLKGLPFETKPIHLREGVQRGEVYRAVAPMMQVPTLVIEENGETSYLSQSLAIVQWLEARFADRPRLVPADPWSRARAWSLAELVNAGIQPLQNLGTMQRLSALGVDARAWSRDVIQAGLAALEESMLTTAGAYSVGEEITVADLCLVPQLYNARRFEIDVTAFPTLARVDGVLQGHPAFVAAHPDQQPDAGT